MANRTMSRISISSIKSAFKSTTARTVSEASINTSSPKFSLPTRSNSSLPRRFSLSRSPLKLGGVLSLLPLHSAVAEARMTSRFSSSLQSCRSLSQVSVVKISSGKICKLTPLRR